MKVILETERLTLREFDLSDAKDLYLLNLDEEVIRYTGDPPFASVEEAYQFVENYDHYQKNGFGRWAVILKENNEFIGWSGLKRHENGDIDLGFRYFKKHWNKGYATEAAKVCLAYGFKALGFKTIIGRAAKLNTASVRVLEKLGMKFWKEDDCKGIEDSVYYRISNQ